MGMEEIIPKPYQVRIEYSLDPKNLKNTPSFFKERNATADDEEGAGGRSPIVGAIPEDGYSSGASASWDAPIEEGGAEVGALAQYLDIGVSNKAAALSKNVWTGSAPMEVSLNFRFITITDPKEDVFYNAKALEMLTMPTAGAGPGKLFLRPPVVRGADQIEISIGNHVVYPFILPQQADVDFSRSLTKSPDGKAYPTYADVSFSFIASEVPVKRSPGEYIGDMGFEVVE